MTIYELVNDTTVQGAIRVSVFDDDEELILWKTDGTDDFSTGDADEWWEDLNVNYLFCDGSGVLHIEVEPSRYEEEDFWDHVKELRDWVYDSVEDCGHYMVPEEVSEDDAAYNLKQYENDDADIPYGMNPILFMQFWNVGVRKWKERNRKDSDESEVF